MKTSETTGYFAYWNARDYAETPRRIRGLHLFLNTACNRQCPECAANVPAIRYPEQYPLAYFQDAANYFHGIEHVTITGGEPTLHPQFRELVPQLRGWFGCRSLTLETNGCHLDAYHDLLGYFDDILLSHYADNRAITEQLAAVGLDGRPTGATRHVATARRARRPAPCRRANFVQYAYGRVYPCACIPSGYEGIGVPLTQHWREDLANVPFPCADCCFAEETVEAALIMPPVSLATLQAPNGATETRDVRPAWCWPQLHDGIKIYGLDLDSWMRREAQIQINPHQSMNRVLMHFESSAPQAFYPLTLTFLNQQGEAVTTYRVERAGVAVVQLDLPQLITRPGDTWITVRCDHTFTDDGRELGIRVCSLRYVAQQTSPLHEEHLRLIQQYIDELTEKEKALLAKEVVIQAQHQDLVTKEAVIHQFIAARQSFVRYCDHTYVRPTLKRLLPEVCQAHLRRLRQALQPQIGVLQQYLPRPLLPRQPFRAPHISEDAAPVISIVTPSFNQATFLERTLVSVLQQNYPRLEYLVQDGGSTDGSRDILARYRNQFTWLESCHDCGQADAINRGFHRTTGEIMAWLNSDDLLLPGALAYVAQFFQTHLDVDVVYGHRIIINEDDQEIGRWALPPHDNKLLLWADYIPQETLFWRRCIWEKAGEHVDESFQFALDWELLLRFQEAGATFVRLPRFLAAFRVHPQQKTSTMLEDLGFQEMMRLRERVHGRPISHEEAHRHLRGYLRKHLCYHYAYQAGILKYS